jgi:low temperature requirement protein LtrA
MPGERRHGFKRWLSRPPRPHGAVLFDRRVSFLEVFYDLASVAVIGQASRQLSTDVSVRGVVDFAVVFGLIWFAWINGSLYVELHGGEDGRTRNIVFAQMCILAVLAVFTAGATDRDGTPFSLVYAAFLVFMTWLWYTVRAQDRDRPEFLAVTGWYIVAMAVSTVVILGGGFLPVEPRLVLWAGFTLAWSAGLLVARRGETVLSLGTSATDSLVERFGTFTIIVLGEVVLGVVAGLISAERDGLTITVGLLALWIGFGFWWIYFDLVGRRLPKNGPALTNWVLGHFPVTLSIVAAGAAMVSLIDHAHDARAPEGTAWLLAGAVALGLLALIVIEQSLVDTERLASVYRPLGIGLAVGAITALIIGWARPAPWLLAALLLAVLSVLWVFAVLRFLSVDAWGDIPAAADSPPLQDGEPLVVASKAAENR